MSDDFKCEKQCSDKKKLYRQITVNINSIVQKSSQTTLGILMEPTL